jgi:hypothetical protein
MAPKGQEILYLCEEKSSKLFGQKCARYIFKKPVVFCPVQIILCYTVFWISKMRVLSMEKSYDYFLRSQQKTDYTETEPPDSEIKGEGLTVFDRQW